jgi:hypothetical protein
MAVMDIRVDAVRTFPVLQTVGEKQENLVRLVLPARPQDQTVVPFNETVVYLLPVHTHEPGKNAGNRIQKIHEQGPAWSRLVSRNHIFMMFGHWPSGEFFAFRSIVIRSTIFSYFILNARKIQVAHGLRQRNLEEKNPETLVLNLIDPSERLC